MLPSRQKDQDRQQLHVYAHTEEEMLTHQLIAITKKQLQTTAQRYHCGFLASECSSMKLPMRHASRDPSRFIPPNVANERQTSFRREFFVHPPISFPPPKEKEKEKKKVG